LKLKNEHFEENNNFMQSFYKFYEITIPVNNDYKIILKLEKNEKSYIEDFNLNFLDFNENSKKNIYYMCGILIDFYKFKQTSLDLSILNLTVSTWPGEPKLDYYGPTGYQFFLKNEIKIMSIKVLLSVEGEVTAFIVDEHNKLI